ncbi:MAG: sigma-54-dependent Fis family transcriptional regulator [Proteobacteria bacterium]|nr:sigma-54-dependent Fis family transcriptional regulator [Pseudomonadota bacterium]
MPSKILDKILVVEDDDALRKLIEEEFVDAGLLVRVAPDAEDALETLHHWAPDIVISDLRLPGADGMWLLSRIREMEPTPGFIIMTAFGTIPQAVEALKNGADDFLTKPLDFDHLHLCVQRTLETRRLRKDVQRFRQLLGSTDFHGIIGRSAAMRSLFATLKQVARASGPVLITGESGTGKDLAARAVHLESPRRDKPFIAVNCAAIPAQLQESEFFGHTAGAFTGAGSSRKGLFSEAEGGTLFLDEIGEMPVELQAKLLRILQDGMVRPVGANRETRVDVRIIAATNKDLKKQVSQGQFREDLYFRLETFSLIMPPLRQRGEDLDLLVGRFLNLLSAKMGRDVPELSSSALKLLQGYSFPGNVRELRNALERAIAFCSGGEILPSCLPERIRRNQQEHTGNNSSDMFEALIRKGELPTLEEMGNRYTSYVLSRFGGNKRRTAQVLDICRATLYRRLGLQEEN